MNKILTKTLLCGLTLSNLLSPVLNAQINPTVPNTTSDHQKQCIGYITQWDHWKGASNKVTPHSYNHLNINYSQYTILNFSFFGVAVDGSLHSADYRNKQIYQPNEVQAPNPLVYEDIYSSYDWFFFKGDVQYYWNWDPFLSTLGYTFNSSTQMWTNTNTGETGSFANGLIETKQNAAFKGIFEIAHSHGVKVMASIGGWSMCKHFKEVAADATKKAKFIADVKKLIKMGFDGIDIDWEYPGEQE